MDWVLSKSNSWFKLREGALGGEKRHPTRAEPNYTHVGGSGSDATLPPARLKEYCTGKRLKIEEVCR